MKTQNTAALPAGAESHALNRHERIAELEEQNTALLLRAEKAERDNARLRAALEDLIGLAEYAMKQANRDGSDFDVDEELSQAREILCGKAIALAKTGGLEAKNARLINALEFIVQHGGNTYQTECGEISCNGSWCADQACAALGEEDGQ